jgi:hypothetical protein
MYAFLLHFFFFFMFTLPIHSALPRYACVRQLNDREGMRGTVFDLRLFASCMYLIAWLRRCVRLATFLACRRWRDLYACGVSLSICCASPVDFHFPTTDDYGVRGTGIEVLIFSFIWRI